MHRMPFDVELSGQAGAAAHHLFAMRTGTDAGQQRLAVRPHRAHRRLAPVGQHFVVNAVGGAAQRQLAQGQQIALAEEVLGRALGLRRQIDLALLEPAEQFVGRDVDHHHLVGGVEHAVRQGLPDPHAGDAADDVVQAFQMLDVERGPDIDAAG